MPVPAAERIATAKRADAGVFIVFEGPEGAGKSTQIGNLAERLRGGGFDPLLTREPGGTAAADAIRRVILDPDLEMSALTEFLLYSASRAQHVAEVIAPALRAGRLVLSDRFAGASVAYQGHGRGLDLDFIADLGRRVTGGIEPDLTLLLDVEARTGLERVAARGSPDRLEQADLAFHRRVRAGFLEQAARDARWRVFDAGRGEQELAAEIWETVAAFLQGIE